MCLYIYIHVGGGGGSIIRSQMGLEKGNLKRVPIKSGTSTRRKRDMDSGRPVLCCIIESVLPVKSNSIRSWKNAPLLRSANWFWEWFWLHCRTKIHWCQWERSRVRVSQFQPWGLSKHQRVKRRRTIGTDTSDVIELKWIEHYTRWTFA